MTTFKSFNKFSQWIEVVDKKTGVVLCRGTYKTSKINRSSCISLDNKYYWNCGKGQKYILKKLNGLNYTEINVNEDLIPQDYIIADLENDDVHADLYVGKTIDECEPEIRPLVIILNKIPGLETVSSGNGSNNDFARVSFRVNQLKPLLFLSQIIDNVFPNCWRLVTNDHVFNGEGSQHFYISLEALKPGKEAFDDIKRLTTYLIKEIL